MIFDMDGSFATYHIAFCTCHWSCFPQPVFKEKSYDEDLDIAEVSNALPNTSW